MRAGARFTKPRARLSAVLPALLPECVEEGLLVELLEVPAEAEVLPHLEHVEQRAHVLRLWGRSQMTSGTFSGFLTSSPLVIAKSTQPPFLSSQIG